MNTNGIEPAIEVKNLDIVYNAGKSNEARALDNINLKIYPNEYVIFYGPSGCGKSTLLYSIAGFQHPTEGQVIVGGQDINAIKRKEKDDFRRRKIGMIFQSFFLIPTLNILGNVCLPQAFLGVDLENREEAGTKLLERFGIAEHAEKFDTELSGGQRQRVAIARALVNNPDIIIADEPVGNLDSRSAFNVMSILRELNEKDKKTVILVTHDPSHLSFGNRVFYMQDGKIVKTEEILERKKATLKGAQEELVKKEILSPELQMLMRAFQNFSPAQLGMLLIPFKAQELVSHIFFNVPDEQIKLACNKLQDVISGRASVADLEKMLDQREEKGGLGWDKRNVKKFVGRLEEILGVSGKLDLGDVEKSSKMVADYLIKSFHLDFTPDRVTKLVRAIGLRLGNELSVIEFRKALDRPVSEGGLGFDRRVATRLARELEIIMLVKYSG